MILRNIIHKNWGKIKNLSYNFIRELFGVVSQEPALFYGTVAENIKLFLLMQLWNLRYNSTNSEFDDIRQAAKNANALDFIEADNFGLILNKNKN